jgi:predicted DCC family thiol-disulfide oxidoreductase YuxK
MPSKPELIYDGNCGFCRYWVFRWGRLTKDRIKYAPSEGRPDSVELVEVDGKRYNNAEAVLRTLAYAPKLWVFLWMYKHIPLLAPLATWVYRQVAAHRESMSALIHWPEK